jgi:hypothetical protein
VIGAESAAMIFVTNVFQSKPDARPARESEDEVVEVAAVDIRKWR